MLARQVRQSKEEDPWIRRALPLRVVLSFALGNQKPTLATEAVSARQLKEVDKWVRTGVADRLTFVLAPS